jgi:hypothetical protein
MNNKYVVPVICFTLGAATAFYYAPTKVKTETVVVEKEQTKTEQDTVIIEKTDKDGTKTKTTTIKTKQEVQAKKNTEASTVQENKKPQYHVSVMAGLDVTNLKNPAVFGVHAQKQFIGPFSLGAFIMTNTTAGVSVGIQF